MLPTTLVAKPHKSAHPQPQPATYHNDSVTSITSSSDEYSPQREPDSGTIKTEQANVGAPLTHHSVWNDMASQIPPEMRSQTVQTTKHSLQPQPAYFRKRSYSVASPPVTEDFHRYQRQYVAPMHDSPRQMNASAPNYASSQAIVPPEADHVAKKARFDRGDQSHGQPRGYLIHRSRPEDCTQTKTLFTKNSSMDTSNQSRTMGPSRESEASVLKKQTANLSRFSWSPFVQTATQDPDSTHDHGKVSTSSDRRQNHRIVFGDEDDEPTSATGAPVTVKYVGERDDILCLQKKLDWALAKEERAKLEVQLLEKQLETRMARTSIESTQMEKRR